MKVAEAVVSFVGDMSAVDAGLGAIPNKAAPVVKKLGDMFSSSLSTGIMAGGAALATIGGFAESFAKPMEQAQATLQQAIKNTGGSWDDYSGQVATAIKKGEDYHHNAADTQQALTTLTVGLQDPKKAFEALTLVQNIAAKSGISQADAAKQVMMAENGKGRLFAQNGIILAKAVDTTKLAATADKNHTTAVDGLNKAQQKLTDLQARDAGITNLSVAQKQALRDAENNVATAQGKEATTADAATKAHAAMKDQTNRVADAVATLTQRTSGFADAQADTFGGKMDAAKTRLGDFAGVIGGRVGPALVGLGPVMMTVGGIMQTLTMFTGAHTAATAADSVAVGENTSVGLLGRIGMAAGAVVTGILTAAQWALNVAMDANPIGLVVLAIAGLVGAVILIATHFNTVKDVVTSVWNAFKGFVGFLTAGFKPELDAITGTIQTVGNALGALNPFAKHSPSLVENVIAGTDIIKSRYTALSGMQLQGPNVGGIKAGNMPSLATAAGAIAGAAGGLGQTIVNNFNAPIDPAAGRRIGRDLAWEMKA